MASKHALESYSRAAAVELGPFGITVNILSLGPIQTGWITPEMEADIAARTPLRRVGQPEDVAVVALFLYSLLPIVRNTHAALNDIPGAIRESADALGLPRSAQLRLIELPLSARAILAGIKTSAVINVGTATLAALIGAGGYGQPILTGIRLDDLGLILQGAVPAAVLALLVQGLFELADDQAAEPDSLRAVASGIESLDGEVRELTRGVADLRSLLFLLFVGMGLAQAARGQVLPAATALFWYAFDLLPRPPGGTEPPDTRS